MLVSRFRPKILINGATAYSREVDMARFAEICKKYDCINHYDMAHISGLVAGDVLKFNPFDYADVVTSTTHKSLRGPRWFFVFLCIRTCL